MQARIKREAARAPPLVCSDAVVMLARTQVAFLLCAVSLLVVIEARPNPDSAGHAPLPGPGLSYGGIPYGSVSGNVAEYFRGTSSVGHGGTLRRGDLDYAPIEQYL